MTNQRLKNAIRASFGLRANKVIKTRIWKVARIMNVIFRRKFNKAMSCFQIEVFFLVFFLCVSSVLSVFCLCLLCFFYYFSFAQLTIMGTTKRQRTHIYKASSNINKVITMTSCRNQDTTPY